MRAIIDAGTVVASLATRILGRTSADTLRDVDGKVIRWFGTNTDITDQLRAEQALAERRAQPQHLRQALRFLAEDAEVEAGREVSLATAEDDHRPVL